LGLSTRAKSLYCYNLKEGNWVFSLTEKKAPSLGKPKTVELEKGEILFRKMFGGNLDSSAAKQILSYSPDAYGTWFLTNRRVIYEGKKTGGKAIAMSFLLGGFSSRAMLEEDILVARIEDIIDMQIVPYAKLDKALKVTCKDNNNTKVFHIGVPIVMGEERTLTKFREDVLRARDFVSFCGNCRTPLTKDEDFCPECGAKRE